MLKKQAYFIDQKHKQKQEKSCQASTLFSSKA